MSKFFLDTRAAIVHLLIVMLRKPYAIILLRTLSAEILAICIRFDYYTDAKKYDMSVSAQIIYLERLLNDRFNPNSVYPNITITDNLGADEPAYMGNASEEQAEIYLGAQWDDAATYAENDEVIYKKRVYKSLADDNTANQPDTSSEYWESPTDPQEEVQYIGHPSEYTGGLHFIVNITADNHAAIDEDEMSATIDIYKLFGVTYTYNIYEEV